MGATLRASKARQRSISRVSEGKISKRSQRSRPGATRKGTPIPSQPNTTATTKSKRESKRFLEAEDGNLLSMVKVGWGLARMLRIYNEKQVEKGLPTIKEIDDVHVLELLEARKKAQQKNTHNYQVRKSALASMGDVDAARKLKWSEQRIRALKSRMRSGSIETMGRIKEELDEGENSDATSASEPEDDYEPELKREPEPELEMDDNIQVAGLPLHAWTGDVALMEARTEAPINKIESTNIFMQFQSPEEDFWGCPEAVNSFSTPPASLWNFNGFENGADLPRRTSRGRSGHFSSSNFSSSNPSSAAVLGKQSEAQFDSQNVETSAFQDNGADAFLDSHVARHWNNTGFDNMTNYAGLQGIFVGAGLGHDQFMPQQAFHNEKTEAKATADLFTNAKREHDQFMLRQTLNYRQEEAKAAADASRIAQEKLDQANQAMLAGIEHGKDRDNFLAGRHWMPEYPKVGQ